MNMAVHSPAETKVVANSMAAPKGHPRWGGRQAGTPNKLTATAREAIEKAFDGIGGVPALTDWAQGNQDAFYTRVWPKILPQQVTGDDGEPLTIVIRRFGPGHPDDPPEEAHAPAR